MYLTVNGKTYEYDGSKLSVNEAILVLEKTGLGVKALMEALKELDPRAFKAVVFMAQRRAGEKIVWDDVDFDIIEVASSMRADEAEKQVTGPDPTDPGSSPNGKNQTPDETNIWPPSHITSTSPLPLSAS